MRINLHKFITIKPIYSLFSIGGMRNDSYLPIKEKKKEEKKKERNNLK